VGAERRVSDPSWLRIVAAWGVHLLTASSAPAGILAVLAVDRGDPWTAFWWMAYTVAIDAFDGTLARRVGVKKVLPFFDGTLLDNVVDYFTYVLVPALFLLRTNLVPPAAEVPVVFCLVLASAYGFCRTDSKTADHYFTGFPSYWNVVVFYLYTLGWPPALNALVVVLFAIGVFIPIRYLYPSRTVALRPLTIGLGVVWGVIVVYVLARSGGAPRGLVVASLAFPVYYVGVSIALHVRHARAA
jgi:phosphatidylcholine synthase